MVVSSRTPEGRSNRCRVCGSDVTVEPSDPAGDAPCPACGHLIWFNLRELGDEQVIRLTETRIQEESLNAAFDAAALLLGTRIVIDFGDVQEITSAALGRLINLKKTVGITRRKLVLRHLGPDLSHVFRITRLDQVFEIEP